MQTNTTRVKTQRTKPRREWQEQQQVTHRKEKRNHDQHRQLH